MARNADSALKLGQARGAAIVAGAEAGLQIAEYTATQVKQAVVGTGGADKQQVQMMVMHLLRLLEKPQIDRSEERRVGKECRTPWTGYSKKKETKRKSEYCTNITYLLSVDL